VGLRRTDRRSRRALPGRVVERGELTREKASR
jgi:hypothetical protein